MFSVGYTVQPYQYLVNKNVFIQLKLNSILLISISAKAGIPVEPIDRPDTGNIKDPGEMGISKSYVEFLDRLEKENHSSTIMISRNIGVKIVVFSLLLFLSIY